jgi:hypothetical protein
MIYLLEEERNNFPNPESAELFVTPTNPQYLAVLKIVDY